MKDITGLRSACILTALLFLGANLKAQFDGPGGIVITEEGNPVIGWYQSDYGTELDLEGGLASWADRTGLGPHLIQTESAQRPYFTDIEEANGRELLQFKSNSKTQLASALSANLAESGFTLAAVVRFQPRVPGSDGGLFTLAGREDQRGFELAPGPAGDQMGLYTGWAGYIDLAPYTQFEDLSLILFRFDAENNLSVRLNGQLLASLNVAATELPSALDKLLIGSNASATEHADFLLAELFFASMPFSDTRMNILQNYMAARYDLGIQNDYYAGDDALKGDYDQGVFGLGNQLDELVGANGGAEGFQLQQVSGLEFNEYCLSGYAQIVNGAHFDDIDATPEVKARWLRDWYVDVDPSNNNLVLDMLFNRDANPDFHPAIAASDYVLLYRADLDDSWAVVDVEWTSKDRNICFHLRAHQVKSGYYTLGSRTFELGSALLVWGQIDAILDAGGVLVEWDAYALSSDLNYILQRSGDAQNWEELKRIESGQIEVGPVSDVFTDAVPLPGTSFYRVIALDSDNQEMRSSIATVEYTYETDKGFLVYPNPASSWVRLQWTGDEFGPDLVRVIGQNGNLSQTIHSQEATLLDINVSDWPEGVYIIRWQSGNDRGADFLVVKH